MHLTSMPLRRTRGVVALMTAAALTLVAVAPARAAKLEEGQKAVVPQGNGLSDRRRRSISTRTSASG